MQARDITVNEHLKVLRRNILRKGRKMANPRCMFNPWDGYVLCELLRTLAGTKSVLSSELPKALLSPWGLV